jgi:hypothetical protein
MDKNERIEITAIQNGYLVEYSFRQMREDKSDFDYRYISEKYTFETWEDVVEWVQLKKLELPTSK